MPRVLISDKLEAPGLDVLRQAGIELDERDGLKGDALKEAVRAADGVIVRSQTKITADLLDNPGLLKAVAVKVGQEVKAGEELAVIEAMKMENVLRAGRDGTIAKLHAGVGDSLAVDQKIIEFA